MKRFISNALLGVFLTLISALPVMAQSQRVINSDLSHFKRVYQNAVRKGSASTVQARYSARIAGFGRVTFYFDSIEVSKVVPEIITSSGVAYDTNPVVLLKGRAKTSSGWQRATGSLAIQNSGLKLTSTFTARRRLTAQVNAITLQYGNVERAQQTSSFQRTNSTSFKNAVCAGEHLHSDALSLAGQAGSAAISSSGMVSPVDTKELELSIHVDASYITSHGSDSQYILARINEVEAIYEDQFAITFEVNRLQFDNTLDLNGPDAETMIENFQAHIDGRGIFSSADLFHLFTAEDLEISGSNSVVGVAYQSSTDPADPGVVCRYNNELTLGITERHVDFSAGLITVIMAHEIGHNFSLEHVATGIMTTSVDENDLPTEFSNESEAALLDYIGTHNACLTAESENPEESPSPTNSPDSGGGGGSVGGGGPTAVPVNLTATLARSGQFDATVSLDSQPAGECVLRLVVGSRRNRLNYSREVLVEEDISNVLTFTYTTDINLKTFPTNKRGRPLKLFVQAFLDCPDASDSGYSPVRRIRSDRVNSRRTVYFRPFANQLGCSIRGDC